MGQRLLKLSWIVALAWLLVEPVAANQCPPPPNPFGSCPLAINRSTLTETDGDQDGEPDNKGSTGGFCGGGSPAECTGILAAEIGFDLVILDPQRQSVTCTAPGAEVWIMSDLCNGCLAIGEDSATLPAGTTTDTTVRVVVADVNGDVCPCGPTLECTFSVEVNCDDGADGDGDGLIDDDDPDCCLDNDGDGVCGAGDCDDNDPYASQSAYELDNLMLTHDQGSTSLWFDQDGAVADIASGRLSELKEDGNFARVTCLADDAQEPSVADTRTDPFPGEAYYYLARMQNGCGASGYGQSAGVNAREELGQEGPCPYDPDCPTCVYFGCDLLDPYPVCAGDQCFLTDDGADTMCIGPAGNQSEGAFCSSILDCEAGLLCANLGFENRCAAWCRTSNDCASGLCIQFEPPVTVDGRSYGFCFQF